MAGLLPGDTFSSVLSIEYLGQFVAPDSDPTIVLYRGDILTSISVDVTHQTNGIYGYSFNVPENWEEGDRVSIRVNYSFDGQTKEFLHTLGFVTLSIAQLAYNAGDSLVADMTGTFHDPATFGTVLEDSLEGNISVERC